MRALFVTIVVLAGGSLVGCAAVAGLDQLSKSSCADDCEDGAVADVTVDQSSDAPADVVVDRGVPADAKADASMPEGGTESGADVLVEAGGEGGAESGVDAGGDAKADGATEAGTDASAEGGVEAGTEGGCGPTNTTSNCGACGNACTPTGATSDSCNGLSCNYACTTGHSDCNASTAPDLDGCECATPGCCTGSCQTTHDDGVGQSYYDCNPAGTYTEVTATEACTAFVDSIGGNPAGCSGGWTCTGNPTQYVCYGTGKNNNTCANYCWLYTGTAPDGGAGAGQVIDCSCPGNYIGPWN